ncbi:MAG: protein kinase [bacterium]
MKKYFLRYGKKNLLIIFLFALFTLKVNSQISPYALLAEKESCLFKINFPVELLDVTNVVGGGEKYGCVAFIGVDQQKYFKVAYKQTKNKNLNKFFKFCFNREFEFLNLISKNCYQSNNIIKLRGAVPDNLVLYLEAAEYDLLNFIQNSICKIKRGETKKRLILHIIEQIAQGLKYIHDMGFIHGDIKPENIVVFKEKPIRLAWIDFSRVASVDNGATCVLSNYIFSTPLYCSNSVINDYIVSGKKSYVYDYKDDLYSLGMVIYNLVYHDLPSIFDQADQFLQKLSVNYSFKIINRIKTKSLEIQKKLIDEGWNLLFTDDNDKFYSFFSNLIGRCLDLDRNKRPSAQELLEEVKAFRTEFFPRKVEN